MKKIAFILACAIILSTVAFTVFATEDIGFTDDGEIGNSGIEVNIPEPPQTTTYTVTFINMGDTISTTDYDEGETITLPANTKTYDDHTFTGWSDGENEYEVGEEYVVNSNVTFTGVWEEDTPTQDNYTVVVMNLGEQVSSTEYGAGTVITVPENTKENKGYVFKNWTDGVNTYEAGEEYTVNANTTLTAVWGPLYGDANKDGKIKSSDVTTIKKYLANYNYVTGTSTVTVGPGADCNGNGAIKSNDVTLLKKYLANYNYTTGTSSVVLGPTN